MSPQPLFAATRCITRLIHLAINSLRSRVARQVSVLDALLVVLSLIGSCKFLPIFASFVSLARSAFAVRRIALAPYFL